MLFSRKDAKGVYSQKKLLVRDSDTANWIHDWSLIDIIGAYFWSSQEDQIQKVRQQSFCIPTKCVGSKCKGLVPWFLNPKHTETLCGHISENNYIPYSPCLWKGGNSSIWGRPTFLQAADNTTTWWLHYLENYYCYYY